MKYIIVTHRSFVDRDMLMRFYLGYAIGHMYAHDTNAALPFQPTAVVPEDVDIILSPQDGGEDQDSGSDSEDDLELAGADSDAMEVSGEENGSESDDDEMEVDD